MDTDHTYLNQLADQIAVVERAPGSSARGRKGERGPYQLTLAVWRQHTRLPYDLAEHEIYARPVAVAHLTWLRDNLRRRGLAINSYNLALAWNAGLTAAVTGRTKPSHRDYASRVRNLVDDQHRGSSLAYGKNFR